MAEFQYGKLFAEKRVKRREGRVRKSVLFSTHEATALWLAVRFSSTSTFGQYCMMKQKNR